MTVKKCVFVLIGCFSSFIFSNATMKMKEAQNNLNDIKIEMEGGRERGRHTPVLNIGHTFLHFIVFAQLELRVSSCSQAAAVPH